VSRLKSDAPEGEAGDYTPRTVRKRDRKSGAPPLERLAAREGRGDLRRGKRTAVSESFSAN